MGAQATSETLLTPLASRCCPCMGSHPPCFGGMTLLGRLCWPGGAVEVWVPSGGELLGDPGSIPVATPWQGSPVPVFALLPAIPVPAAL